MKRSSTKIKAAFIVALLLTFLLPVLVKAVTRNIVSNDKWLVSDANGNLLGTAQNVCLNAGDPQNCPASATQYGWLLPGGSTASWTASLSSIPGATWIWAPNITGATSPATNAEYTFETQFYLCEAPSEEGTIYLAADNSAEVFLNGASVGSTTSFNTLSSFTVPVSIIAKGQNVIQVKAKNGPNLSCTSDQYQCNPAGIVFGGTFKDAQAKLPQCIKDGKGVDAGFVDELPCPPGMDGKNIRVCACFGSNGYWVSAPDGCKVRQPTCTKNDGTIVNVDDTESVDCPQGRIGSATRTCTANGWGPNDDSACQLPLVGVGDICGSIDVPGVYTATCPSGTECKTRLLPSGPRTLWCALFGIDCPSKMKSTNWYCDPP